MSTSTICLPAHILDAHITPRAREVLMLLASQTSSKEPALWICQAELAARLRCSSVTVARAIKQLVEAKLVADTGRLHEGRYKIYHVRWSAHENIKAVSKKITKPVRKNVVANEVKPVSPPVSQARRRDDVPPTIPPALLKDSRIAHFAEISRKQFEENRRLYQAMLRSLG